MWIAIVATVAVLLGIVWMIWRDFTGPPSGDDPNARPDNTSGGGGGG